MLFLLLLRKLVDEMLCGANIFGELDLFHSFDFLLQVEDLLLYFVVAISLSFLFTAQ